MELRARAVVTLKGTGAVFLDAQRVEEVCHRLDEAGYRETADAIRNRPRAGAVLTDEQKVDLREVLREWARDEGADEPEDVATLRDALEAELGDKGEEG